MTKGERIKQLRKEKGISQVELAKYLDTTKQTISKYEKSIVTNIPSDKVEKMAILFNTTPQHILGWEEKEEKSTVQDDGLTENQRKLMQFVQSVPDDKADMILRVIRSIVEAD